MDRAFIRRSILGCLSKRKKRLRFDTVRLFARLGKISEEEARLSLKAKDEQYLSCVDALAEEMQRQIHEGDLHLSELYHEVSERMWHERRTRRAGTRRVNLVRHILLYMDDVLLLGRNAKHLHEAVRRIVAYCRDTLCLNIKPSWTVFKLDDKHGVDMMGYKLFKGFSTIRRRVFKRLRRCTLRMLRRARVGAHIPISMARRFISLSGYLTHTDSWRFCHRYHVAALKKIAGLIVSHHDHNKTLITA